MSILIIFVLTTFTGIILGLISISIIKKIDGCYLITSFDGLNHVPIMIVKTKQEVDNFMIKTNYKYGSFETFGWKSCNKNLIEIFDKAKERGII